MTLNFFLIAFLGGAVSITSPCTLPLLPPFIAYIAAAMAKDSQQKRDRAYLRTVLRASLFMVGVLFIFGASANPTWSVSLFIRDYKNILVIIAGIFILGLGLTLIKKQDERSSTPRKGDLLWALPAGFAFGLISIACCLGRVISAILMTDSSANRNALIFVFVAGLGVVFLAAGTITYGLQKLLARSPNSWRIIRLVAGIIMIIVGLLVISGLWTEYIFDLQRYSASAKTLPIRLEESLLEAFGAAN